MLPRQQQVMTCCRGKLTKVVGTFITETYEMSESDAKKKVRKVDQPTIINFLILTPTPKFVFAQVCVKSTLRKLRLF